MALQAPKISNPLTLIAVFVSLAEVSGTIVLPSLAEPVQSTFVWFVMGLPIVVVAAFFATLNFNTRVLYAPSDYSDEENFMRTLIRKPKIDESYVPRASNSTILRDFWRPGGEVDATNEKWLRGWMAQNGQAETPLGVFLSSNEFAKLREKAIGDLPQT
jgi:hypothetical protein